jgi:NAD(P)-dependent dehydrogenase (short-subunit alcohol dehydrogenase family)
MQKLEEVISSIVNGSSQYKDSSDKPPQPQAIQMHLDSLKSVREGAEKIRGLSDQINVLICNAGIMASPYSKTEDGFELQIGTNHFSQFLLFQELLPQLKKAASPDHPSRVITLSSEAHLLNGVNLDDINSSEGATYQKWTAYAQSKTANIYMTNSVNRHYASEGVVGLAVHPGVIGTGLMKHSKSIGEYILCAADNVLC